ncbi:coiled-coil domain-containing protein 112 [Pseudorasbora parva]|uniref:coiled-coil domain-containing protein 112 n=1 Tax=Pseudorasbora parva TaxID=51549 RepID=UPI00351F394C
MRDDIVMVQQQLQKLQSGVFRFQQQLMDATTSPEVVDKLRDTMTDIEKSISMFKDSQHHSFEELLKDERMFWLEICGLQQKMEAWSVCVCERAETRVPRARSAGSLPEDLTALQMFLQRSGPRGGWDEPEHRSFLRLWRKHRGKPSYRREARLQISCSEEELEEHERWFLELTHLQERRREAVLRWRAAKQSERQLQREQMERDGERKMEPQDEEMERLKQEQRRERMERLEAWRRRRRLEQEQEEEQRLRQHILQTRRAKEEQRRQLELKLRVEEHRQKKKEEAELRQLEEEAELQAERAERGRRAAQGIRRFQERKRGGAANSWSRFRGNHGHTLSNAARSRALQWAFKK